MILSIFVDYCVNFFQRKTVWLEYAKAYPILSLLSNKGDKTAAIDAYWLSAYNLSAGFDPSIGLKDVINGNDVKIQKVVVK